jgi:hypothetical protein
MARGMTAEQAVFESVTGKQFLVPWMRETGRTVESVEAISIGNHFVFRVRFGRN